MTDNKKVYSIEINGIEQSIKQVDALIESLKLLDEKVKSVEARNVNISATEVETKAAESPNYQSRVSELQQEDALLKQIEQTEQKIAEVSRDEYQELLHQKDVLKDLKNEGASRFAEDNLAVKEYSNTMAGLKARLADIKKAMQFKEIGSEGFNKLVDEANEINTKLKDIESSYGQFGRNVGNYANGVAEGMQKIKVNVGGVEREFNTAKEASRELGNELKTMAVNGQQGTKEFKEMQKAVAQLNSSIKDATVSSSAMDNMLDTLQSFAAIGSVTQGFSALFGFDDSEIEKSIQKLVALQNVMKGIEEIQQQMNTGEGLGGWLSKGNDAIDSFVDRLFNAKEATEAVSDAADTAKSATEALGTVTKGTTTATEGLTVAQNGQTVATKAATVATKGLSLALKAIGIGLVISLVATLITYWDDLVEWFEDTIPALKNLSSWFDKLRAVAVGVGTAIVNYMVQPLATLAKVIKAVISGNFADIPKIIGEGLNKTFNVVQNFQKGYNKETERQQKEHNKKVLQQQKEANEEWMKDEEAKNGKSLKLTEDYIKKQQALIDKQLANEKKGSKRYEELLKERRELDRKLWSAQREDREKNDKKNAAAAKKAAQEEKKLLEEAEKEINALRLRIMDEGLNKKLIQLNEEKRQTLNKLKGNNAAYLEAERMYEQLRLKAIKDYLKDIQNSVDTTAKNIEKSTANIGIKELESKIKDIDQLLKKQGKEVPVVKTLVSKSDYDEALRSVTKLTEATDKAIAKKNKLIETDDVYSVQKKNVKVQDYTEEEKRERLKTALEIMNHYKEYTELERKELEVLYQKELAIIKSYGYLEEGTLQQSFTKRIQYERFYFEDSIKETKKKLEERRDLLKQEAEKEYEQTSAATKDSYCAIESGLTQTLKKIDDAREAISKKYGGIVNLETNANVSEKDKEALEKLKTQREDIQKQIEQNDENHYREQFALKDKYDQKLIDIDLETEDKISAQHEKYFNTQISNFRDLNSKLSQEMSKQPIYDNFGFGIINLSATKKNFKELEDAAEYSLRQIQKEKEVLSDDFNQGLIKPEAYNASMMQLNDLEATAKDNLQNIEGEIQELGGKWWGSINQWLQLIGQTVNDVMGSLSEITANRFEREISQQEKYIQEYSDLLDKQKEKTQEYASAVDSIEDELSTARGDRRQHLIDQLNAEMAAQRASLAQQKKIEKEREKAEEKKKKLEHDQAVAKKKMDLAQAAINTAMAISMAAVNKWPVPAIPMMALAAAAGAAQYAAIASQNIPSYGSGGVLLGKSHKEGGIKVLGGRAEVEGGEFITNKLTTTKNVEVLEYINSKRRKLYLEDFIDFYGGKKSTVKKNVQSAVKTKFADGGVIPTLRNDIELSDRLLQTFEDYSNRPVQVAVVDIIDGTQRVNDVRVMAGIES